LKEAIMLDTATGRWLTKDPAGFMAQDANLYRYVGNDPTNATDPTGKYVIAQNEEAANDTINFLDKEYKIKATKLPYKGKYYIHAYAGQTKSIQEGFDRADPNFANYDILKALESDSYHIQTGKGSAFLGLIWIKDIREIDRLSWLAERDRPEAERPKLNLPALPVDFDAKLERLQKQVSNLRIALAMQQALQLEAKKRNDVSEDLAAINSTISRLRKQIAATDPAVSEHFDAMESQRMVTQMVLNSKPMLRPGADFLNFGVGVVRGLYDVVHAIVRIDQTIAGIGELFRFAANEGVVKTFAMMAQELVKSWEEDPGGVAGRFSGWLSGGQILKLGTTKIGGRGGPVFRLGGTVQVGGGTVALGFAVVIDIPTILDWAQQVAEAARKFGWGAGWAGPLWNAIAKMEAEKDVVGGDGPIKPPRTGEKYKDDLLPNKKAAEDTAAGIRILSPEELEHYRVVANEKGEMVWAK
jgi:hypothetical protein